MKLFTMYMHDNDRFILVPQQGLDAYAYTALQDVLRKLPERRYDNGIKCWIVPVTGPNCTYIQEHFTPEQYEIDEAVDLRFRHQEALQKVLTNRQRRRLEFHFEDKVPELSFTPHTKPYNHQVVALDALHKSEYFALLMEMGTGKTKVVIDEIAWQTQQKKNGAYKVLILAPLSVTTTWVKEFAKHMPPDIPYWIRRCGSGWGLVEDVKAGLKSGPKLKIWVMNYDKLAKPANQEILKKVKFDLAVADESDAVKNAWAKRTKALHKLRYYFKRRVILTGTPSPNTLCDLWSQFHWLEPGILGYATFDAFKEGYCEIDERSRWKPIIGYKNVNQLKDLMSLHSFIVKKQQCLDLPPKSYMVRFVDMGAQQRKIYTQMVEQFIAELEGDKEIMAQVIIVKMLRLAQICGGFSKTIEGEIIQIPDSDGKLQELEAVFEAIEDDKKVIIWARFREEIRQIAEFLEKNGISHGQLHGDVSVEDRQKLQDSFNTTDGVRVVVGNPQTGGLGMTFVGTPEAPCSTVVYYSNDFSYRNRAQSEDRCHRIGMSSNVTYIDLVCNKSIDEMILDKLQKKAEVSEMVKDISELKAQLLQGVA